MDSFLLVDNVAFECARPAVAPLEVRFAHPVRLPPDTHSQVHGRPCLQSRHPRPGFPEWGLLHVYVLTYSVKSCYCFNFSTMDVLLLFVFILQIHCREIIPTIAINIHRFNKKYLRGLHPFLRL